jgi:glycosyltransferase involved in cell wall biosynthesis
MNKIKVLGNRKREKLLSQKCDFVITTSNVLFERNKQANVNTYLVENGFIEKNFSFNDVVKNELMEKLKKPVIGYVGNIRNWMDFDMLEYLIKSNPNYTFIFIGEVNKNAAAQFTNITTKYSNICITGRIPYYDLFRYFFYIDIGIIPFKVNEFMLSVNPNKFYEFMGAGIPVVATNMGDLKAKYSDIAKIAQDKYQFNEFVRTLAELPKHEILNLKVKILELSKFHTWESKAELFYNLLNKLILSKN